MTDKQKALEWTAARSEESRVLGVVLVSREAAEHSASVGGDLGEMLLWHRHAEPVMALEPLPDELPGLPHCTWCIVGGEWLSIETRELPLFEAGPLERTTVVMMSWERHSRVR